MAKKLVYLLALLLLAVGVYFVLYDREADRQDIGGSLVSAEIPDPYYLDLKKADVHNPDDIIRYSSSIKSYADELDVFERAAFYEWYFKSHGFNVSFAYSENFDDKRKTHVWLLVRTQKGEVIEVDPSYKAVEGASMLPLNPEYGVLDFEFGDIYEASEELGVKRWAWWKDETAHQAMNENVILAQKEAAMKDAFE